MVLFLSGHSTYSLAALFTVESIITGKIQVLKQKQLLQQSMEILFFTHTAHCSLRLRITDNGGMSKTRFSGMYSHADKVRRQVDRSNTCTYKSFIT